MAVTRQIIDRETIKSTFSRPRGNPASTRRCDSLYMYSFQNPNLCLVGLLGELGANCFHGFCADPFLFATAPISRIVDCALRDLRCKCRNIFLIKVTEMDAFSDMETIHHLNSIILSTSSPEINRLVCSLICSLAMLDKNKAKFGVAGTVQVLVSAISGPRCPASHHLLSSLAELVQFHGNCTVAVRSGAVQVLIGVVESTDGEDLAGTSLAVLGHVARFNEGLNALIRTDQIVSSMLNVLRGRCLLSKEGAAEILLRLFDESEGCIRDAFRLPEFSSVLADISVRGSSKAREKANQLLKKMVDANLDPYTDGNSLFLPWYQ
ncbi:hypothetical protein POTOM_026401 [Populus tomentosa]|uniref:ARM repeat superfamily protein n=1 Tax=Populus tomentosa TaxID=118781 RepID=A0A8X7ZMT0_POPTO|nr:hypothetical protein POTOM_026401 [Populus tomentosa]